MFMSMGRVRELKEGIMQRKGNINNWNAYSLTTQLKPIGWIVKYLWNERILSIKRSSGN